MQEKLNELKTRLAEWADLGRASAVLGWDQQTYMPPGGGAARAQQLALLRRLAHERFTADALGRLLDDLSGDAASLPYDSDDASLIRITKRDYDKARKVPPKLVGEMATASAHAFQSWQKAKAASRFTDFAPSLQRNLDLRRELAKCL
ncbi:MAG: carboxypeptidase M32, partial [Anaerolineales bacterium]|nr:carboxypeptidase M32 [Anaerolineales bacterium]